MNTEDNNRVETLTVAEVLYALNSIDILHGNIPVILYDLDSSYYFTFTRDNIEIQKMDDGSMRVSIGINSYQDQGEEEHLISWLDNH